MDLRQFGYDLIQRTNPLVRAPVRPFELDVMAEDWDTLVVLDACRCDVYRDTVEADVDCRLSPGTASGQFMRESFGGETHHDTVYVTANPWALTEIPDGTFFETRHVWDTDWDDDLGTVRPESVVEAAVHAFDEQPDKRYVVHFMQPHHPFLGPKGRELGQFGGFRKARSRAVEGEPTADEHVWDRLDAGELAAEDVYEAYVENLEYVLPHAHDVAQRLGGRTVFTSDHGNLFDEFAWPYPFRFSGHPERIWTPKLVRVPWHVVQEGDRETVAEQPLESADADEDVREKLADLGYY